MQPMFHLGVNPLQVSMDLGESGDYIYSLFIKRNSLQPLAPRPDPYGPQIENRNREVWCCLLVLVSFLWQISAPQNSNFV